MSQAAHDLPDEAHSSASTFRLMSDNAARKSPTAITPLARLIKNRKTELGLTWQEIGKRGGFTSHTTVHALANKTEHRQAPRRETLERLAKALNLPLDLVSQAAAQSAGYGLQEIPTTLSNGEDIRIVAAAMNSMSEADRAKLRMIAQAFADAVDLDEGRR